MDLKTYVIGTPNAIWKNLLHLLDKNEGRVDEFPLDGAFVYHIDNSTVILEAHYDEDRSEDPLNRLELVVAASDRDILHRGFEVFLDYVRQANPRYDISQIEEQTDTS